MEEISLFAQKYNKIKILFKNENKEVSLVENKDNKEKVIIKEMNLSNLNEKEKEMSLHEGMILSKLKHPNIIECYGFNYKKDKLIILMKYEEGGYLLKRIKLKK